MSSKIPHEQRRTIDFMAAPKEYRSGIRGLAAWDTLRLAPSAAGAHGGVRLIRHIRQNRPAEPPDCRKSAAYDEIAGSGLEYFGPTPLTSRIRTSHQDLE
jgi:hypothetical protein